MASMQPPPGSDVRTDGKAIGSLVCGILSLVCFSILTGIPAVILGHLSRSSIRNSMGRLKGEGMALAGLVMGYISIVLIPVILIVATIMIPSLLRARQAANEAAAIANLRSINSAEASYQSNNGGQYGDMQALIRANLVDDTFNETKAGYNFTITASATGYTAEANPATPATARYGYYTGADSLIRYSTSERLAPPGLAGQLIQ